MNDLRKACFVLLALVGLAALAQTPPAGKALKSGAPVFIDFGALPQTVGGEQKAGGQAAEIGGQRPEVIAGTNVPAASPVSLSGHVPEDKYKLRVGDRVSLQILEDRDAPRSLVVADSGELDVPYVGRVQAADKTSKQLADELKTQLEKEYYHRATVVISLDLANKLLRRVYVWGQARNQGPIDVAVNENLTAVKAILGAGGFADFANKKRVKVVRGAGGTAPANGRL